MAIWWSSATENVNNWDLYAVVRGCTATTSGDTSDPFSSHPTVHPFTNEGSAEEEQNCSSLFADVAAGENALHELDELCRPFFSKQEEPQRRLSPSPRSKRRKNQQKKVVCQVPADGLSSDMWAWRKYGQKPIKGSPYPRGYYRCSSSKGCLARKQVERSRTDPTTLVVTYTGEHNHPVPTHRNSLAGSTRTKFPPLTPRDGDRNSASKDKTSSGTLSDLAMTGLSPTTPLTASMEDELLMPKADIEEPNDDDEDDGMVHFREMMDRNGVCEKIHDDTDDEDFVRKFFSNVWQGEGGATGWAGGR